MLTNSYIHLPEIGTTTKRKIWTAVSSPGINSGKNPTVPDCRNSKLKQILEGISTSKDKLNARDHTYFANNLPKEEHSQAYRDYTIFLDIETTGLSPLLQ